MSNGDCLSSLSLLPLYHSLRQSSLSYDYIGTLAILPDLGLGRLIPPDGHLYIQGGAEHKKPILPLMSCLPPRATILSPEACDVFASAIKQASNQVKAVIKNGAAPQDEVISSLVLRSI